MDGELLIFYLKLQFYEILIYLNFRRKCNRYIFHRVIIIDFILANALKCLFTTKCSTYRSGLIYYFVASDGERLYTSAVICR